jgi:uncharacterized protein (DUF1778 family)
MKDIKKTNRTVIVQTSMTTEEINLIDKIAKQNRQSRASFIAKSSIDTAKAEVKDGNKTI